MCAASPYGSYRLVTGMILQTSSDATLKSKRFTRFTMKTRAGDAAVMLNK